MTNLLENIEWTVGLALSGREQITHKLIVEMVCGIGTVMMPEITTAQMEILIENIEADQSARLEK